MCVWVCVYTLHMYIYVYIYICIHTLNTHTCPQPFRNDIHFKVSKIELYSLCCFTIM